MHCQGAKTRVKKSLAMILVGAAVVASAKAHPQASEPTPSNEHPLWQADPHEYGYSHANETLPNFLDDILDFTDNNQVAWAWLTPDNSPTLTHKTKKKGLPQPEPAHLHVLIS